MTRSRLITLLASAVLLLAAPRLEAAESCTSKPVPVIYVTPPIAAATVGFSEDLLLAMTNAFREGLWRSYERSGSIKTYQYSDIVAVFGVQTKRQLLGLAGVDFVEGAQGLGAEYVAFLKIGRIAELRVLNVEIFNARSAVVVAAAQEVLASPGAELMTQMKTLAGRRLTGLDCTLRSRRIRPVVPVVTLTLAPTSLLPGAPLTATAVLKDLENGQVQVGKPINFTHVTTRGEEESHWGVFTDFSGFATQALTAGPFVLDSKGKVRASFRREEDNFVTDPVEQLYDVVRPNRNLSVQGTRPKLGPGSADQLAIGLTRNSAPAAGVTVTVSASAGVLGAASVVTSSQGSGSVTFTTPSRPGIVEIRASAPGATSNEPPVADAISYVVDAGIAMSMNAKDTIVSSPSTVTVDLDRDGRALAGATVTFALSGGGFLDAASATTDSAGRAQVVFAAPPQVGASTVTASVTVDGQTISRTVTIAYRDPRDSITREIGEVILAVQTDPSDANLQRLLTLRNLLRSLGQESRAEQVLEEVDGELYCVHQRADDTCRSGSGAGNARPAHRHLDRQRAAQRSRHAHAGHASYLPLPGVHAGSRVRLRGDAEARAAGEQGRDRHGAARHFGLGRRQALAPVLRVLPGAPESADLLRAGAHPAAEPGVTLYRHILRRRPVRLSRQPHPDAGLPGQGDLAHGPRDRQWAQCRRYLRSVPVQRHRRQWRGNRRDRIDERHRSVPGAADVPLRPTAVAAG